MYWTRKEGLYWIDQAAKNGNADAKKFLNNTPHGNIMPISLNPFNWGDVFDAYPFWSWVGVILLFTPLFIIDIPVALYILYRIVVS